MEWLKRKMAGRYGSDQLSLALIILSMLLLLISGFLPKLKILLYISYVILAFCIYRTFSKNINKRRMENYKFLMLISPLYSWSRKKIKRLKDAKTYKYFKCPNCKTKLRLPKRKGKIIITCPKCKTEFIRKT